MGFWDTFNLAFRSGRTRKKREKGPRGGDPLSTYRVVHVQWNPSWTPTNNSVEESWKHSIKRRHHHQTRRRTFLHGHFVVMEVVGLNDQPRWPGIGDTHPLPVPHSSLSVIAKGVKRLQFSQIIWASSSVLLGSFGMSQGWFHLNSWVSRRSRIPL